MKALNYKQKTTEITAWLSKTVKTAGFSRVIIALSGGIDSAVSLNLAVKALGKENAFALLLPYGKLSNQSTKDAKLVIQQVGLAEENVFEINIKKAVDVISSKARDLRENEISHPNLIGVRNDNKLHPRGEDYSVRFSNTSGVVESSKLNTLRLGNIMARVRMIYLFDTAKSNNALVCGTENLTEHYLGYFTRFGDEASDLEPIRSLYKAQVFELATCLGVPKKIITKAPSANLWENQSDEGEFGFSYQDADRVLYHYFEEHLPPEGIVDLGIPEATVAHVLAFVQKNNFKHKVPFVFDERKRYG